MSTEKSALQDFLSTFTADWASLNAAVAQRQQEVDQINQRINVLKEEILRNQGAMAYNQIMTEKIKKQMADIETKAESPVEPPAF